MYSILTLGWWLTSQEMYSYGTPHMAVQKQDDQHEHTFSSYVRIRDVVLKTCLGRWTIGRSGERESGISVLPARHDDDDDCYDSELNPCNIYELGFVNISSKQAHVSLYVLVFFFSFFFTDIFLYFIFYLPTQSAYIRSSSSYLTSHSFCFFSYFLFCPVDWSSIRHTTTTTTTTNECPGYNTKQSDGEIPVMLELWGMRGTTLPPSLPGPLRLRMGAPDKGPIYGLNRINPWFLEFTGFCI